MFDVRRKRINFSHFLMVTETEALNTNLHYSIASYLYWRVKMEDKNKKSIDLVDYLGGLGYYGFGKPNPAEIRVDVMEASPAIDMSNIRAEDRPYVHEVIQYLRQNGLRTELKGSAEFSKEYNDIDILAKGSLEDVANTVCGLKKINQFGAKSFYETAADGKKYEVVYEGAEVRYMNTRVAQLFRIIVGDTKIHVGLKVKPKDKTPTNDSDPHYFGKAAAAA